MSDLLHHHRLFCEYSLVFKGNTPRTIKWLEETMKYFVAHTGAARCTDIDRAMIERYMLTGKLEHGWSAKTIRNRLLALRGFLDWCVNQDLIVENPAGAIDLPRLPKSLPKHLPKEDALTLLEWTRNTRYAYHFERVRAVAIISTFIFAGLRRKELLNLKFEHVRIQDRTIFVQSGKGEKDRLIPMSHDLTIAMSDYQKERDRLGRDCPSFFVCLNADKLMGEKAIQRLVTKLRDKSGIYFYPHMLRHTFATLMLEGGADIFAISKLMGHGDIKTTTIYLSASTAHLKAEIDRHPLSSIKSPTHQSSFSEPASRPTGNLGWL